MKRYKVMMVAVLGVIVLLLSFAPMPAATTAPTNRRREIQLKELARWV